MNYGKAICGLIAAAVLAEWAEAHHSAAAAFTNDIIEVEGTVTEFNFTNPHIDVYFDVTGEDGEVTQWRASGSAANLMRRRGWTAQTIQPGQYLRVTGREARNGVPMVLLGSLAELDPGDGSLVRNVEGESDYDEPVGAAPLALTLSDGSPNFTAPGPWVRAWVWAWAARRGTAHRRHTTRQALPPPRHSTRSATRSWLANRRAWSANQGLRPTPCA